MPNVEDITAHLLEQDVIWVFGGSVAGLLAMWRLHGVDEAMRAAWQAGVVLTGVSAGSICWHVGGTTDSFGPELRPVTNGLGFVPYSNGVHYDSEEQRRPLFQQLIADGTLPAGYATDDGVGVLYRGTEFVEAVSEQDGKGAYFVERGPDGAAVETALDTAPPVARQSFALGRGQLRRPPDLLADVVAQRRHEDRAHQERVEQHAERDGEPDLGEEHDRQHAEHDERRRQHAARPR